jgi:hypothetical protein
MKTALIKVIAMSIIITGCTVDDYTDANPPRPKDGPAGFMSLAGGNFIVDTETDGTSFIYLMVNGGNAIFNIDIVDAPGLLDSVGFSNEFGEAIADLGEAQGQAEGLISVTYTPEAEGDENLTIVVFDAQSPRKSVAFTPDQQIKTVDACFASRPLVGFYGTVTSGFDSETGSNYTDLEAVVEFRINAGGVNHPGLYRLTDGSFGLYPLQGFANNFINVTFCGDEITNANEEFTDLFSGTLNADGTITVTWSNSFGDTGVTVMTPQ